MMMRRRRRMMRMMMRSSSLVGWSSHAMGVGHSLNCEQKSPQHEHWTTWTSWSWSTCPDDFLIDNDDQPYSQYGCFWVISAWVDETICKLPNVLIGGSHACNCHHRCGLSANLIIDWSWWGSLGSLWTTCWSGHQSFSKQSKPLLTRTQVEGSLLFLLSQLLEKLKLERVISGEYYAHIR